MNLNPLPPHLKLFSPPHPNPGGGRQLWGLEGGSSHVANILLLIRPQASSMPWKKDLLATLLSFCPIVEQNPAPTPGVSVSPHLPMVPGAGLLTCIPWAGRVQDSMFLI